MSVFVSIEVNDYEARSYFEYAGYHARDMRRPLRRIKDEVLLPGIFEQFATEGGRSGGWQPLNPVYEARKLADGFPPDILIRTGEMYDAIIAPSAWRITRDRLTYNPRAGYKAELHQEGGSTPGRPPQREWLVVTPEDYGQMEHIWGDWLDELRVANARRHGFAIRPDMPDLFLPFGGAL